MASIQARARRHERKHGKVTVYEDSPSSTGSRVASQLERYRLHRRRRQLEKHIAGIGAENGQEFGGAKQAEFFGASARTGFELSRERLEEISREFGVGMTYITNLAQNLRATPITRLQQEAQAEGAGSARKTAAILDDLDRASVSGGSSRRRVADTPRRVSESSSLLTDDRLRRRTIGG